ncbi:Glutamate Aspartate transport system permease protein GltJ [Liberibacter crescens BT-1]|uniref:Glutamate Aspartate transport system permease protein GltJ n=1 Tax=Liberibacter crescens (strain BT-1) TaxID=1215343 RepID=L0EWW9_LIBCB|nr:amino acid ABC transporter permease [Liberibacter crescens]AGA64876.1 Glutamate Aspartate transport system permease protein GltJ [Liberibacter crescens BT-1]AMC12916.1 amino acid ABC transporter permease [Liberibacter crescens]
MIRKSQNDVSNYQRTSWFFYNSHIRSAFFQIITLLLVVGLIIWISKNVYVNLLRINIASGFGFLKNRSGFDIDQTLIPYTSNSSYFRALVVGFLNTLTVTAISIIPATLIGLFVGIGRLSSNKLVSWICRIYVEIFRNIPPLLVIFFCYKCILSVLPNPRSSIILPLHIYINNRGISFPKPILYAGFETITLSILAGLLMSFFIVKFSQKYHDKTGKNIPSFYISMLFIIALPIGTFIFIGCPIDFDFPRVTRFNLTGGLSVGPEFISLNFALSFYTASFISEIFRSGIVSISKGQLEAAISLGLRQSQINRFILIPQAIKVIIPPLTSQYLNLLKNSSLAVAIGFADLVSVGGTILNQTGQAIEIVAIWISVYLSLSIMISLFMNWFNKKVALVEK